DGEIRERASVLAERLAPVTLVVAGAWAVWAQLAFSVPWTWAAVAVAAVSLVVVVRATRAQREGWAFTGTAVTIVAAVVLIFRSDGGFRERASALAERLAPVTLVVAGAWAVWAQLAFSVPWTWAAVAVAAVSLVVVVRATRAQREGWAFTGTAVTIVAAVVLIF